MVATRVVGIIPIARARQARAMIRCSHAARALERGEIIIVVPGGNAASRRKFPSSRRESPILPNVPQVRPHPFSSWVGKALPKGDFVLVPFFCDVFVGEAITFMQDRNAFMNILGESSSPLLIQGVLQSGIRNLVSSCVMIPA